MTVSKWIDNKELTKEYFLEKPREELYSEYTEYCKVSGMWPYDKPSFFERLISKYDFASWPIWKKGDHRDFFINRI